MAIATKAALCLAIIVSTTSPTLARGAIPTAPYGTPAEQQQCVANMEASLGNRSILGSRDTSEYIQDRGNLDSMGLTEYDVMVGRCMDQIYHRYTRLHGGHVR
jgi:hypothetical protein